MFWVRNISILKATTKSIEASISFYKDHASIFIGVYMFVARFKLR